MKIKIKTKSPARLNEGVLGVTGSAVTIAGFLLGTFLKAALAGFSEKALAPIIEALGGKLNKADSQVSDATSRMPKDRRDSFEVEWNEQKKQMKNLSDKLQEIAKDPQKSSKLSKKPSKLMAERLRIVAKVINKAIKENSDNPEVANGLKTALKDLVSVYKQTARLDYVVLVSDKTRPDGLWNSVISKNTELAGKLNSDEAYKQFSEFVMNAIDPDASQPPEFQAPSEAGV